MSDLLYRKELLRLAADAHGAGRLAHAHVTGEAFNPTCGDKVIVDLALVEGRIAAVAHETRACVLAQASASILGQTLQGNSRREIEALRDSLRAMLEAHASAPPGFAGYATFEGAATFPARHRCVLLPVEAVLNALDRLEST